MFWAVKGQNVPITLHGSNAVSNFIYDIEQDLDGVIYLATDMGLATYDGRSFQNYGHAQGLKDEFITEIALFDEMLLILHFEGGVSLLNLRDQEQSFTHLLPNIKLQSIAVLSDFCYVLDHEGNIYELGTDKPGFEKVGKVDEPVALSAYSNKLLVGTNSGVQVFDPITKGFLKCSLESTIGVRVFSKSRDGNSNYYLNKEGELFRLSMNDECLKRAKTDFQPKGDASFILESNTKQKLYISSMTRSIDVLATTSEHDTVARFVENINEKNGLVKEMVKTLFMDAQGNLWIGGFGSGLSQIQLDNERSTRLDGRVLSGFIHNEVVHAIDAKKYYELDPNALRLNSTTLLDQKYGGWSIIRQWNQEQGVAVLNGKRVFKYDLDSKRLMKEFDLGLWDPIHVNDILIEGSTATICSDAGLCIYDLEHDVFEVHGISTGLPANRTLTVARLASDTTKLLIGFDGGSLMTISNNKQLEEVEVDILNYRINNLVSDGSFSCFSAVGEGLYCDEGTGFKHVTLVGADELSENFMIKLKSFGDNLLLAMSSEKVSVLERRQNQQYAVIRKNEGKAISCNDLLTFGNRAIFFSEQSVYSFLVTKSGNALIDYFPINIKRLSLNGLPKQLEENLEFDHADYKVSIEFNSPEFNSLKNVNYQFRLLGFDEEWTETNGKQNVAFYPKLSSGDYTFQVRILDQPSTMVSQNFIIQKPLWQRTSFLLSCLTAFILVAGLGIYYREQYHLSVRKYIDHQRYRLNVKTKDQKREIDFFKEQSKELEARTNKLRDYMADAGPSLQELLDNSFVLDMPQHKIGGDFVKAFSEENVTTIMVADCTGSGVSGTMMSVICSNAFRNAFKENSTKNAAQILGDTQKQIWPNAPQGSFENRFGLVAALCKFHRQERVLEYAGANLSLTIVSKREIIDGLRSKPELSQDGRYLFRIKASRLFWDSEERRASFPNRRVTLEKGDMVYTVTNGFANQFGGSDNLKLKSQKLKELLLSVAHLPVQEQQKKLAHYFNHWKGIEPQTDDVLVLGFRA